MLFFTLAVFWAAVLPAVLPAVLLPATIFIGMTLEEATSFFGVGLSAEEVFSDSFAFAVGDEGDFTVDDGETGDLGVGDRVVAAKMCLFSSEGK